ncbi:universal stress protein [Sediminicola luteus]|uniref:Universal stress protein UspA n=1 Tax=Sediminicola luteus TaxID=319238 RepID=A0A2A4G5F5_9FLAO|nr:universal stress protein [Sediminicola luteus]PCE62975.1 universal stress protein UspA [Sediminicola luteus]
MKNILVPIGSSPTATNTLQYAVDFAREFSSDIYVMEVLNIRNKAGNLANVHEKLEESTKERLKGIIESVHTEGVTVKIATASGDLIDGLKGIDKQLGIDLIIMAPKSNDVNEAFYLGATSGRIIKRTNIPTLIVPKGSTYKAFGSVLTAFKSGVLKRKKILFPLEIIKERLNPVINLLFVKTPGYSDEDLRIDPALMDISSKISITENATTYLGVIEHFQEKQPDLLCVFRRKRGFFRKLWEKNNILKSEFYVPIPVLVLSVKKD